MANELVKFTDGELSLEVQVSPEQQTVWLTQKQMGSLFGVKQATISEHINNILSSGELDETSIGFSDKSSGGRKPRICVFRLQINESILLLPEKMPRIIKMLS